MSGYWLVFRPGNGLSATDLMRQPGFLLLAALMLLADLYPLVPWMRDVRVNVLIAWSVALSLAAVLAYGPGASLLFLGSGIVVALSRHLGRWWQILFSTVVFGLIGVVLALLSTLADIGNPLTPPSGWSMAAWGLAFAVVVVVLYSLLIALAVICLGVSTWPEQRREFVTNVRTWGVGLVTAPLLAALALGAPWTLPSTAVIIVLVNHVNGTMVRSTAASQTDGLTGLANRLTLMQELSARIARLDGGDSVTLLMIDLDRFKEINDTFGHLVGDEVLVAIARRLRAAVDQAHLVARYGGDEFAVVMAPGTDELQASAAADAFRAALAEPVTVGDSRRVIGGSVGIARTSDPTAEPPSLVELADQEMYRVKRSQATQARTRRPADQEQLSAERPPMLRRPASRYIGLLADTGS